MRRSYDNDYGTPYECKIFHRVSRRTLSNAFFKSMKLILQGDIPFQTLLDDVSQSKDLVNTPLPFLNLACSCVSLLSIASPILFKRTKNKKPLHKILLGMDSRVLPRQLSQFWRSPSLVKEKKGKLLCKRDKKGDYVHFYV